MNTYAPTIEEQLILNHLGLITVVVGSNVRLSIFVKHFYDEIIKDFLND